MSALPILVEWGHVISKLVVGGLAGGALLAYRAWRNKRDVMPAREDAHHMALSINEPREGPIAVRGTYRIANDERWLECGGERISFASSVAIVRGSGATWQRGTRTYTLRDGDSVIAIGTMTRGAGAEATDYREAAGGWRLGPSAPEPAIQVCIAKPVALPRPLWPVRGLLVLALVGAGSYFGLGYVGGKLLGEREYPREPFVTDNDVSTCAAEVACALPRHRDKALNRYSIDLEYKPQTEDILAKRIAIATLRDCGMGVDLLQSLKRYDEAIELAADCGHPEYARASLIALARYDEAARDTTELRDPFAIDPLIALIGAGRWTEAAAYVDRREHRDVEGDRCFARYLRSLAGTKEPAPASGSASAACRIVDGQLAESLPEERPEVGIARWAYLDGSTTFFDLEGIAVWLAPHTRHDSYATHVLRAQYAIDLGRFDEAASEVEKALATQANAGPGDRLEMERHLRFPLALRTGKPIEAFEDASDHALFEAARLRSGTDARELRRLGRRDRVASAVKSAAMGNGLPLAETLEAARDELHLSEEYLFAIAPAITEHRAELLRTLRNQRRPPTLSPPALVHALAIDRDLARMLGDPAEADRLQALIDRHVKAFGDPERQKALLLALIR